MATDDTDRSKGVSIEDNRQWLTTLLRPLSIIRMPVLVADVERSAEGATSRVDHLHKLRIRSIETFCLWSHWNRDQRMSGIDAEDCVYSSARPGTGCSRDMCPETVTHDRYTIQWNLTLDGEEKLSDVRTHSVHLASGNSVLGGGESGPVYDARIRVGELGQIPSHAIHPVAVLVVRVSVNDERQFLRHVHFER